jgi:hypothetical protein
MNISIKHFLAIGLLTLAPLLESARAQSPPRFPVGIYAVVPVEEVVSAEVTVFPHNLRGLAHHDERLSDEDLGGGTLARA